ncbi:MAG: DEAD/DEAH box helicase [Planctomycetaceae bacterium]
MTFPELGLAEPFLRAIASEGYTEPTPIQAQAIPPAISGRDLLGCAQTGTGKTAAFALPILHRLLAARPAPGAGRRIRALVLSPTRELAAQIAESFSAYGRNTPLRNTVIFGGVNQNPQVKALRNGVDVLVATPGRLLDLLEQRHIDLRAVEVLVLDEADRMLDLGFFPDIRRIVSQLSTDRQTLMFSATMPDDIRRLARSILRDPLQIHVAPVSSTAEKIEQGVYHVSRRDKPALLRHLLKGMPTSRTLVFTRTKRGADRVVKDLVRAGFRAAAIHGNKSQSARERALDGFRSQKLPVLVATDIAARGIDVDGISHVFNYDVPDAAETYVHRIGRTARAGASGIALSFCDDEERGDLRAIEQLIRRPIDVRTDHPHYPQRPDSVRPAEHSAATAGAGAARRQHARSGRVSPQRQRTQEGGHGRQVASGTAVVAGQRFETREAHNNRGGSGSRSRGRRRRPRRR